MTQSQSATDRGAEKNAPVSLGNRIRNLVLQGLSEWAAPRSDQVPLSRYFISFDHKGTHLREADSRESQPLSREALAALMDAEGAQTLDLVFEGDSCIDLSFGLPDAILPELQKIAENEIAFRSPFSAAASHAFWVVEEQKNGRWRARAAVLLRNRVDEVLTLLTATGMRVGIVRRLGREGSFAARPAWAGHAPAKRPSFRQIPAALMLSLLGAVIFCGSALALLLSTSLTQAQLSDAAAAARASLAGQAQSVSELRRLDDALALSTEKLAMTGRLSALLPDGVWLDQLVIDDDSVTIIGFAPSAAEITRLLSSMPGLTDVQFGSPVTRDNSQNLERFRIVAALEGAVP